MYLLIFQADTEVEKKGGNLTPNPRSPPRYFSLCYCPPPSLPSEFLPSFLPCFTLYQWHRVLLRSLFRRFTFIYSNHVLCVFIVFFYGSHWLCMPGVFLPATVITDRREWVSVCAWVRARKCVGARMRTFICAFLTCKCTSATLCLWVSAHNCVCLNELARINFPPVYISVCSL